MKNILVSGASGFLGKALISRLLESGFNVIGISRSDCGLQNKNLRFIKADISDYKKLHLAVKSIKKIDCFVHLAASIYYGDDAKDNEEMVATNVLGTYNAIRLAKEKRIKSFIYASSMSAYKVGGIATETTAPNPESLYGATKLAPEFFSGQISNQCKTYILRFSGLYGPKRDSGIIYKIANAYANNKIFDLGQDGQDKWNPLYIDDAVNSIIFFIKSNNKNPSGIYNVGLDSKVSIRDINNILVKITGKKLVKFSDKKSSLDFFMRVDKIKKSGFRFENIEKSINKFYQYLRGEKT
tara:strand:- start:706 stop:1596 length:891 start_codon:yes stop_codon:yes gene_type:complete